MSDRQSALSRQAIDRTFATSGAERQDGRSDDGSARQASAPLAIPVAMRPAQSEPISFGRPSSIPPALGERNAQRVISESHVTGRRSPANNAGGTPLDSLQRLLPSVVKSRSGSVLSRGFILKTDHYPSGELTMTCCVTIRFLTCIRESIGSGPQRPRCTELPSASSGRAERLRSCATPYPRSKSYIICPLMSTEHQQTNTCRLVLYSRGTYRCVRT